MGKAGCQGPARLGDLTISLWPQAEPSPGPRVLRLREGLARGSRGLP